MALKQSSLMCLLYVKVIPTYTVTCSGDTKKMCNLICALRMPTDVFRLTGEMSNSLYTPTQS